MTQFKAITDFDGSRKASGQQARVEDTRAAASDFRKHMLAGPKAAQAMQFGAHGTTFGGNPLAAAVARVALRKLSSPEIGHNVGRQSQALRDGLGRINDQPEFLLQFTH